jgi:hypothetical protein
MEKHEITIKESESITINGLVVKPELIGFLKGLARLNFDELNGNIRILQESACHVAELYLYLTKDNERLETGQVIADICFVQRQLTELKSVM